MVKATELILARNSFLHISNLAYLSTNAKTTTATPVGVAGQASLQFGQMILNHVPSGPFAAAASVRALVSVCVRESVYMRVLCVSWVV
jgi:hypothetical protein